MPDKKTIHVTKNPNATWSGKREGASRPSVTANTQAAADKESKKIARKEGGTVITHGLDGTFKSHDSFGPDPNPPKDKEH